MSDIRIVATKYIDNTMIIIFNFVQAENTLRKRKYHTTKEKK